MIARSTAPWPAGAMAPDPRDRLRAAALVGFAVLAAIAFGAALPADPRAAVVLVAVVPLALGAPVASLGVLLLLAFSRGPRLNDSARSSLRSYVGASRNPSPT